jgi:hypothetical protein
MSEHGKFQDKGVKGVVSSLKAPKSPYKFGSGKGKKGGLTNAIDKWVRRKRFQFTNKKGKFLSYEQTAKLITRSIYLKGIEPTNFYSRPFELGFKRLPDELIKSYSLDIEEFFNFSNR